jgi:hypothetical protein
MARQILRLAGKRFVVVEESQYQRLMEISRQMRRMSRQDWGDVAESKRRLAEPGASISWKRIKAERAGRRGNRQVA